MYVCNVMQCNAMQCNATQCNAMHVCMYMCVYVCVLMHAYISRGCSGSHFSQKWVETGKRTATGKKGVTLRR